MRIHTFENGDYSSCSSFATYETDIVTVGEDGRINFLTAQRPIIVKTIGLHHKYENRWKRCFV